MSARYILCILGLCVASLLASSIDAGVLFEFETTNTDEFVPIERRGRVQFDASRYRVDYLREGRVYATVLSRDSGATEEFVDHDTQTFYRRSRSDINRPDSRLFAVDVLGMNPSVAVKEVRVREVGRDHAGEGWRVRVTFSYEVSSKVSGERVRARVNAECDIWLQDIGETTEPINPLDARRLSTGFIVVDDQLGEQMRQVKGFPMRRELRVTRRVGTGKPQTDTVTTVLSNVSILDSLPGPFEVPEGYRFREPQFGMPGSR